jgi:transposase
MHAHAQRLVSIVKMVIMLEEYSTEEQHSVVCFLLAEGLNAKHIHKEMFPVYSGKYLLCKAVHNWVEKFSQGSSEAGDDARPGRPVEIVIEATMKQVGELIRADRMITIDSVASALGCSHGWFEVLGSVRTVGAQRTEGLRKNELNGTFLETSLMVHSQRR